MLCSLGIRTLGCHCYPSSPTGSRWSRRQTTRNWNCWIPSLWGHRGKQSPRALSRSARAARTMRPSTSRRRRSSWTWKIAARCRTTRGLSTWWMLHRLARRSRRASCRRLCVVAESNPRTVTVRGRGRCGSRSGWRAPWLAAWADWALTPPSYSPWDSRGISCRWSASVLGSSRCGQTARSGARATGADRRTSWWTWRPWIWWI